MACSGAPVSRPLYQLPDELFAFMVNGVGYSLDIIDCFHAQNRIAVEAKQHPDDDLWFLRAFGEWVAANGGPPAGQLRTAQLDALFCKCREEFFERKKSQRASLASVLSSPSSTGSAPMEPDPADPLTGGD